MAGISGEYIVNRERSCPQCEGNTRWRVYDDFGDTGGCRCNHCGAWGDGFAFLEWKLQRPLNQVVNMLGEHLNCQPGNNGHANHLPETQSAKPAIEPQQNLANAIDKRFLNFLRFKGRDSRALLAEKLGVAVESLQALDVGFSPDENASTWPERTAGGVVIGIKRRFASGDMRIMKDHNLGLYFADNWQSADGPVLIVEGGSDTAAAITLGLPAIGRPSALVPRGVLPELVAMLQSLPVDRPIIVVAENDKHTDGKWPGKVGAIKAAQQLTEALGRPIPWALPPSAVKDLRAWLKANPDKTGGDFVAELTIEQVSQERKRKKRAKAICESRSTVSAMLTDTAALTQDIPRHYDDTDKNDIGNSEHFVRKHRDSLRYCAAWKKWLCWDGARWKLDDDDSVMRLAKEVVREIFNDALNGDDDAILKWGMQTANISRLRAMVALASSELSIALSDMDQDPWLLNCINGTVDLKSGELKPHRRSQSITKLCESDFNPDAMAPVWNQFLQDVFADDDLIQFVQRLFGHFLTGDVSEQKLALFYGTGANGKSTLLNAFMETIGPDYTMQCMPDFLMEKKGESHPTEKASLFGKRFVSCVETEQSRKLAESTVKMLTGGEKIMARRMREDFWQFDPTHKLVLCTNHRPVIAGTDHGIWRRLLLVPFLNRFDGERQDKHLPDKLKAERDGILAWAVQGCLEWQRIGLNPPASVSAATEDYRSSEDIFGRFIADCCVVGKPFGIRFSELYTRFTQWANDTGDYLPSKKAVGIWLDDNGFEKYSANGRCYRGLMVRSTSEEDINDQFPERTERTE